MGKLGLSLLVSSMLVVPVAALSQENAAPSADDYVCALTGECADQGGEPAAPDAAAPPAGTPRVSATRGFSLSRPAPERPAPRQTTTRPAPRQTASRPSTRPTARPARPVAQQPGRVDLRLAFGPGSATLTSDAYPQIRAFAEALQRPQLASSRVRIEGHTDSSGGRTMNMELSQRRAQAVADFLTSHGIPAERIEVRGYGYDRPLPGHRSNSQQNRRVEAVRIS